jgi:hypothetical protein
MHNAWKRWLWSIFGKEHDHKLAMVNIWHIYPVSEIFRFYKVYFEIVLEDGSTSKSNLKIAHPPLELIFVSEKLISIILVKRILFCWETGVVNVLSER